MMMAQGLDFFFTVLEIFKMRCQLSQIENLHNLDLRIILSDSGPRLQRPGLSLTSLVLGKFDIATPEHIFPAYCKFFF